MKRFFCFNAGLGVALLAGCTYIYAQNPPTPAGPTVRVVVTAEAHHSENAPTVNRDEVMVFEGKDRDTVTDWIPAQGDHAAMELFIVLDDSSNVTLGTQLQDLRQFINEQAPTTKVGIAYMQNGIARIEQSPTPDHAQAAKALRLPMGVAGVNASPYFSISDLVKKWPADDARHEIFLASDGIDRYYGSTDMLDPYLSAAIEDAQKAGVVIYSMYTPGTGHFGHSYWLTYWGQLYLARLSEETGGEAYYIGFNGPPVAFTPYLDQMEHHLQHQYWLAFQPKPEKKAGMQRIRVTTEMQNVDLVYPRQVYVPAP